jgi:SNF2 family DNA or RNA helicase
MLSNVKFNPYYNTYENDIVNEFYNKALSEAVKYKRVSAYFSAKSLSYYSRGISNLINNNGRMQFIISKDISEETYNIIVKGYKNRELIEKELLKSLEEELSTQEEYRMSNLAYLIERGYVDIKIALVKQGIFHDKYGLIEDNYSNIIYFKGSNNETVEAMESNYESFDISVNWNDDIFEKDKIENAEKLFDRLWQNEMPNIYVMDIPDIVRNRIIKFNKDKEIISDFEIEIWNSVFLDIDEEENFKIVNRLPLGKINKSDLYFQLYLNRYLNFENNEFYLKKKVNYQDIKKIINSFKAYSEKAYFKIIISHELEKYLSDKDMQIDERFNLGIDIKNRENWLEERYEKFKEKLDTEMERKLKEPQVWNAFHIVNMWKSANFSVPGAGKTSIVYGAYAYLNSKDINVIDKIVMIGPKNSFSAWKEEFEKNFGNKKQLKVLDLQDEKYNNANKKNYALQNSSGNKNLILVNYETLKSVEKSLMDILNTRILLVFDEEHKIKGINGIRANVALKLAKQVKYKIILTGTPIPNGYQDIYNCLKILYPDEYDYMFNFTLNMLKNPSIKEIEQINKKIYPFYCRITKKDLNIPGPNEDVIIKRNMNEIEKRIFKYLYSEYRDNILALYIRLMQASCNPKLLLRKINYNDYKNVIIDEEIIDETNTIDMKEDKKYQSMNKEEITRCDIIKDIQMLDVSSKFKAGIDEIQKLIGENKQVLVWGIFIDTLLKIKLELDKLNISSNIIYGDISNTDRQKTIEDFKQKNIQVLIANPNTLAESVSLHMICHDAIYFEYSFNLTHMLQSKDRINRLGLDEKQYTQYYYLMLENDNDRYNAIDEKIYLRLKEKEKIMKEAIEGEDLPRMNFDDTEDLELIMDKH